MLTNRWPRFLGAALQWTGSYSPAPYVTLNGAFCVVTSGGVVRHHQLDSWQLPDTHYVHTRAASNWQIITWHFTHAVWQWTNEPHPTSGAIL